MDQPKRLYRSTAHRMLAGVCAGLGDYFGIDPTLIRVIFVILIFGGGFGLAAYIILWVIIPEAGATEQSLEQRSHHAAEEIHVAVEQVASTVRGQDGNGGKIIFGIFLIALGIFAFAHSLWPWAVFRWSYFWPMVVIVIGLSIVFKRK